MPTMQYTGEEEMFSRLVGKSSYQDWHLRLFITDRTPSKGDTIEQLEELSGSGYAPIVLEADDWTIDFSSGETKLSLSSTKTFTLTAAVPEVHGYMITDPDKIFILYAEKFSDGPYVVPGGGDTIDIDATFTIPVSSS